MLQLDQAFSTDIFAAIRTWFEVWQLEPLLDEVRVRFSSRMYRTVGRCYPQRRELVLAAAVKQMETAAVVEILCHELAHLAAFEHFGHNIRPHGRQWRDLVAAVGQTPNVRFHHQPSLELLAASAPQRQRYLHLCPMCEARRISVRRMPRWRCGACYEIGRSGRLQIIALKPGYEQD